MAERLIDRFTANDPCPVCGGFPGLAHGKGIRCTGFRTDDNYAHCTREERAGSLPPTNASPPTYAHILDRECDCGHPHVQPWVAPPERTIIIPATLTKTHPYVIKDFNGKVIAIHERREYSNGDKKFAWKQEGGRMGLDGTSPADLLYGLDKIAEEWYPVVITEGEKAADALDSLKVPFLVVLGTVCGAPHAPSGAALMCLRGRKVALWPDNDEAGLKQMQITAQRLDGIAAEVRLILWGEKEKDDAADFVERGGTAAQFTAMARTAPLAVGDDPNVVNWANVKVEEVTYLWHPYIPNRKVTLMEGPPGTGKSFAALSISACVTRGRGLPRNPDGVPGRVMFMSAEDGIADTLLPRIKTMDADLTKLVSISKAFTFDRAGLAMLDEALDRYKPALVVFDPLFAFFGGKIDINRANETRELMTALYDRAMRTGCAILAIRHLSKSGGDSLTRGLGSVDILAAVRSVLLVGQNPKDETKIQRAVVHLKSNLAMKGPTLLYDLHPNIGFRWHTETSALTEDDILRRNHGPKQVEVDSAVKFISTILDENGPMEPHVLTKKVKDMGMDIGVLWQAEIDGQFVYRHGVWRLPTLGGD